MTNGRKKAVMDYMLKWNEVHSDRIENQINTWSISASEKTLIIKINNGQIFRKKVEEIYIMLR